MVKKATPTLVKNKKRKSIPKSVRFEVFKRDDFRCQYCGSAAPDVVLEVDHIQPVSKDGTNDIMNLVTACKDCNQGKSDKTLGDRSAIERQRAMLEELNERREQLEMMLKWREELKQLDDVVVSSIAEEINSFLHNQSVNENGLNSIRKWLKRFSFDEIMSAIEIAADRYLKNPASQKDVQVFFSSIPKICSVRRMPEEKQRLFYARGILRNRLHYVNDKQAITLMARAADSGVDVEEIVEIAKTVKNWTEFRRLIEEAASE